MQIEVESGASSIVTARTIVVRPVGFLKTPFTETSQISRGIGAKHDREGTIEILPELEEGLTDIEGFSHLYVIWLFHRSEGFDLLAHPQVDTPPHGVFATRAPRRPNPIGLTVVRLLSREENELLVRGVDMLDGTPVLDIKPYLSSVPAEELSRGWVADVESRSGRQEARDWSDTR